MTEDTTIKELIEELNYLRKRYQQAIQFRIFDDESGSIRIGFTKNNDIVEFYTLESMAKEWNRHKAYLDKEDM